MTGRIVKGISGFYYVFVAGSGIYECKAKGAFRKQQIKPLVGDLVEIDVLSEENHLGNVVEIIPRKNALIRPAVANVAGIGDLCNGFSETESEFVRSVSCNDGISGCAGTNLL